MYIVKKLILATTALALFVSPAVCGERSFMHKVGYWDSWTGVADPNLEIDNIFRLEGERIVPREGAFPPAGFWKKFINSPWDQKKCWVAVNDESIDAWAGRCPNDDDGTGYGWGVSVGIDGNIRQEYVGNVERGLPNGFGTLKTWNGTFAGIWRKGYRVSGKMAYRDGTTFEGSFGGGAYIPGNQQPSYGVITYPNGQRYAGHVVVTPRGLEAARRDDSMVTLLVGGVAAVVVVAATGAVIVGAVALAAIRTNPAAVLIILV